MVLAVWGSGVRIPLAPLIFTDVCRQLSPSTMQAPRAAFRRGEPDVGLYLHGAHLVRSRRIRHFMATTGVPAPQDPDKTADLSTRRRRSPSATSVLEPATRAAEL